MVVPMDKMQSLEASDYSSSDPEESTDYHDDTGSGLSRSADFTLLDTIERILDKGLVINGDISIDIAGSELLSLRINLVIASLETAKRYGIQLPWENWNNEGIKNQPIENHEDSNIDSSMLDDYNEHYGLSGNLLTKSHKHTNASKAKSRRAQQGNGNSNVHYKTRHKKKSHNGGALSPRTAAYCRLHR
jgi:hypothetical protein